ncbi:MAG: hydrolase [Nocardioidaceae bacterium]|nr:hydrolase [Nocardioidaceae bacterium]
MKALVAVGLFTAVICGGSSAVATTAAGLSVTGYALEGSATPAHIKRDADYLDVVGVDGITLLGSHRVSKVSAEAHALRRTAQRRGMSAVLLVSNFDGAIDDFNEKTAYSALRSASNRNKLAAALVKASRKFDGVQIDLESLKARDRKGLTALTRKLHSLLPEKKSLSMAFMASGNHAGYKARGYNLKQLGKTLDRAVLMAYDFHGPTWSKPGAIGPLAAVRRELAYFASQIPRAKVELGIATYGYQWDGNPAVLTVGEARKLAGDKATWSTKHGELHAKLDNGATLWWSDQRSLRLREDIAATEGIGGIAIWQIGASAGALGPI